MNQSIKVIGAAGIILLTIMLLACGVGVAGLLMGIQILEAVQYKGGTLRVLRVILPMLVPFVYSGTFIVGYYRVNTVFTPQTSIEIPVATYIYETPVNPDEPRGAWGNFVQGGIKVSIWLMVLFIFCGMITAPGNLANLSQPQADVSNGLLFEVGGLLLLNLLIGSAAYQIATYPMEKSRKLWLGFGWIFIVLAGWFNWQWWQSYAYPIGADLLYGIVVALFLSLFAVLYISRSWNAIMLEWKPSCLDSWFLVFFPITVVMRFELFPRIIPPLFFFPLTAIPLYFYIEAWRQRPRSSVAKL